jgi:glycosyltransferase involved in cell wall biosynthesis
VEELISVIVPIYKVEKYLKKCIDSIINQTYRNLEIILVDDGSPDRCGEICDDYKLKDERVVVIHKENGGLSDARNVGLDIAKGNYIMFVDSDDYIAENMVYKLYSSLKENNADMSLCTYVFVEEQYNFASPIKDEVISGIDAIRKMLLLKNGGRYTNACCKLYKSELFEIIRFPLGKVHEDEFISHLVFAKCKRVSCISDKPYFRIRRDDSIMGKLRNEVPITGLDATEAFIERSLYLKSISMEDKCVSKAYCQAISPFDYVFSNISNPSKSEITKLEETRKLLKKNRYLAKKCTVKQKVHIIFLSYLPKGLYKLILNGRYKIKNK